MLMKDALGAVQSVLVLGGNSDIALATVEKLIKGRTRTVVLAGRSPDRLKQAATELEQAGAETVEVAELDALAFDTHHGFVESQFSVREFDLVIVAFGMLGNQESDEQDARSAVEVIEANYTGAVSLLLPIAQRMKRQGHGSIVVLSSVAGERARAANFIYGSSKAGLDAFCQGLGDSLVGSGVTLTIVRPGFVKTKMTAHMSAKPLSTTADAVADDIITALARGNEIVWSPAKLRYVMTIFRHLPRPIFRKIKQ